VLMWLMKTLLTSRCINQRGAGQMDEVEDEEKCPLLAHGGPLAQLTVRAVPEADLAYCQVSVFTGSRSARLGISIIEY
ncbi:hypothetical protein, partial [Klebsiella pneumoniae]